MQLDLFEHSRDVALRNDVVAALRARDSSAAKIAIARLAEEFPVDDALEAMTALAAGLIQPTSFADHDDLERHSVTLEAALVPAAAQVFGAQAGAWLQTLWRQVAAAAAGLDFDPRRARSHAAQFLLRGDDYPGAADAVRRIASWRRKPVPLAWMTEAVCRDCALEGGFSAGWPLLAELAWLAPPRFAALAERLTTPPLTLLRQRFGREFEGDDEVVDAWFPAWACLADASLADGLKLAQWPTDSRPERAARCIVGLLTLERQGRHRELIAARAELRDTHSGLFAFYMRSR